MSTRYLYRLDGIEIALDTFVGQHPLTDDGKTAVKQMRPGDAFVFGAPERTLRCETDERFDAGDPIVRALAGEVHTSGLVIVVEKPPVRVSPEAALEMKARMDAGLLRKGKDR